MYPCCAFARHAARGAFTASIIGNRLRSRVLPICSASLKQFQVNPKRVMSTDVPQKVAKWSPSELEDKPQKSEQEIHPLDTEKWTLIYRFNYINGLRLAVRAKIYQAVIGFVTMSTIPVFSYFGFEISQEAIMGLMVFNLYVFIATLGLGHYSQKMVGILYINEPRDKVRVATLSFAGHRRDVMYDLQDIMRISDFNSSKESAFVRFKRFSDPEDDLFLVIGGATFDRELLEHVFGKLPEVAPRRLTKFSSENKKRE